MFIITSAKLQNNPHIQRFLVQIACFDYLCEPNKKKEWKNLELI